MAFGSLPSVLGSGGGTAYSLIGGTGLFADGTAAAPSISFAADSDTGFYRVGANEIGFTANGTRSFTLSTDGVLKGVQGANYLEMNGTGRINLVAGGTAQNITLTPSTTGQVSHIGLSNFSDTLFFGNSSGSYGRITWGSALTFQAGAGLPFTLVSSNGTEVARGFANGRFGIGTGATDSGALLQVGTNTTTSAGGMVFGTDTFLYRSAGGTLELSRSGTAILALNNIGNRTSTITGTAAGYEIDATGGGGTGIFKTSGTVALTLDSSQNATFAQRVRTADGTLALPGHSFGNDTASGMYRAGTNTLGFSSGGALSLTLGGFGEVVCGASGLGTTTTDGFFYLRAMAGAPTGVPTAFTGRVAATYDSTNNRLYIYNGGWKSVVLI